MMGSRRPVFFNPSAASGLAASSGPASAGPRSETGPECESAVLAAKFHRQMPGYQPTRLVSLEPVARQLGLGAVFIKDESCRLGLPSFKILGASWGTFRAVVDRLDLGLDTDLETLKAAIATAGPATGKLSLFAATDGNHGRAVARMGSILSLPVEVHVPAGMVPTTVELILSEGAKVVKSRGDYEAAMARAYEAAQVRGGILVQDCGFEEYQEIPQWIVQGYETMLTEIDEQLGGGNVQPDLVIAPVGVGSFAQAVVSHYKRSNSVGATKTRILTVESDTAPCLWKSLSRGQSVLTATTPTIMAGLECGAVSTIAWPLLQTGVDASLTVSDHEAHAACLELEGLGVKAGPCGAATLAALRRLGDDDKQRLGLGPDSIVVLLCTEGKRRGYAVPFSVFPDDVKSLARTLAEVMRVAGRNWREATAQYIISWLQHRDISNRYWVVSADPGTSPEASVAGVVGYRGEESPGAGVGVESHKKYEIYGHAEEDKIRELTMALIMLASANETSNPQSVMAVFSSTANGGK